MKVLTDKEFTQKVLEIMPEAKQRVLDRIAFIISDSILDFLDDEQIATYKNSDVLERSVIEGIVKTQLKEL